jgi:hypothetical protein
MIYYCQFTLSSEEPEGPDGSGAMFCVLFKNESKDMEMFRLSNISIGGGLAVFCPSVVGEWTGMAVLHSTTALLHQEPTMKPFEPVPLPVEVSSN